MIWLKKRFKHAEYGPAMDRLEKLLMAMPQRYAEFLMVSTRVGHTRESDYYVGVPTAEVAAAFPEFERITESDLPKEIDTFHLGDQTKEPFTSRFRFRKRW